jgi:hypothetical protein
LICLAAIGGRWLIYFVKQATLQLICLAAIAVAGGWKKGTRSTFAPEWLPGLLWQ